MACLALSLQPLNGADVLLQTREWFPPARAALASYSFRAARGNISYLKSDTGDQHPLVLGNDLASATSGQVVVGKESKYRVVYRLVNSIYVLGITTVDHDVSSNVFECASTVNQAVSVLVAACKGIDVTADKLLRKYTEVYMALDVVLRGVSAARLATILSSFHGEGIAQIVVSATDAENRVRGAESWNQVKVHSVERLNQIDVLSSATFELPEETLAAGDQTASLLASPAQTTATVGLNVAETVSGKPPANEDPFAASDAIDKPVELTGAFKKDEQVSKDGTSGLSELTVPVGPGPSHVLSVKGFEGDYGELDYDPADGGFGEAFEGLTDAFGGGLDPSEFGATTEKQKKLDTGLGGLEELEGGGGKTKTSASADNPAEALGETNPAIPNNASMLWLSEEISAEYEGSTLGRVGLQGSLQLRTVPPSASKDDTEFSFGLDGIASIKRSVLRDNVAGSLGDGIYHVRTPPSDKPITILKYFLQPRFTPIPLRLRLFSQQNPLSLSCMIQYVANPYLRGILKGVNFMVSLPFSPSSLKMSPRGILNHSSKEIRWFVPEIMPQTPPKRLRFQLPLTPEFVTSLPNQENGKDSKAQELKVNLRVEFSCRGQSLSGISVTPISGGSLAQFSIGEHIFKSKRFLCS